MADRKMQVIVTDPDNEGGVRVVDHVSGTVIATGHLVVGVMAESPTARGVVAADVRFVGEVVGP